MNETLALFSFLFGAFCGWAVARRLLGPVRRWRKPKLIRLCRFCGLARESITHRGFRGEPPDHEFRR